MEVFLSLNNLKNSIFSAFFCKYKEVLILVLFAFIFNLAIASLVEVVNPDCVRYANSAYQLLNGNLSAAFAHEKMLFYSLTLGVAHVLFNDWVLAGQFISVLFLSLTILPLYFITRDLFNTRAAVWAAVVFILLPLTTELAGEVVKDAPFLFFLMSAIMFGCKAIRSQRPVYYFATFLCVTFSTLYRFEGIVFYIFFNIYILIGIFKESCCRVNYIKGLISYNTIPTLLVIATSIAYAADFFSSSSLADVWARYNNHYLDSNIVYSYNAIYSHLASVEKVFVGGGNTNDFFEIARYNIMFIYLIGVLQVLGGALSYVYLLPLFFGIKTVNKCNTCMKLLIGSSLCYLIMIYFFIITRNFLAERYTLSLVVMLLPFVGFGLERFTSMKTQRYRSLAITLSIIFFVLFPLYKSIASTFIQKTEIRMAGEWLQANRNIGRQRIMTTDERVPFYAGLMRGSYNVFPAGDSSGYEKFAVESACSLIILDLALKNIEKKPIFVKYALVKELRGKKKVILIYEATH